MGVVSALGDAPEAFAAAALAGNRTALGPSALKPGLFTGELADFKARKYIAQKGLQVLSRSSLLAAAAISRLKEAVVPLLDPSDGAAASRTEIGRAHV